MDRNEIKSIIEALLFTWGDPLDISDISSITEVPKKDINSILDEMVEEFSSDKRGLQIIKIKNSYQIGTKSKHYKWIKKLNKPQQEKNLSNAALETLSIIAYKQPIIKSDIEAIRGVKCDTAIYTLLDKNMIEEKGRLERVGRPILYGTTEDFLKAFGLENLEKLPPLMDDLDISGDVEMSVDKQLSREDKLKED